MSHHSITQTDTFTGVATGTQVDVTVAPLKSFGIAVTAAGGVPTLWTVLLEGSLDGSNWSTLLTHASGGTGLGVTVWSGAALTPVLFLRSRVTALTLGVATSITVLWLGTQ